jgi:ribosomal protein L11 methyltransferase
MQPTITPPSATWLQLKIPVPAHLAEDASACLIEAGALGVLTLETPSDTQLLACYSAETESGHLVVDAVASLADVGLHLDASAIVMSRQDDADWAQRWKQYFKPVKVGRRMWIVPSWETKFESPTGSIVLNLDPGTAFGTGQHATTALCIKATELFVDTRPKDKKAAARVLDVGCGTGILGLAAAKLGVAHVLAIDNDPQAVEAAAANAATNGVMGVMKVEALPLGEVAGTFDLIVANILAPVLIDMAPALLRRMAPRGTLVLSGILLEQADEVIGRFLKCGDRMGASLRHDKTWTHGEWVALQFVV